ncbi:MAG: tripartite tricarboxylate transporter TctB family protein, partial [Desulfofustis sp.]|nr:tripartite tricarboxylate transporter TctB family protein [Desulfofustis sp.]
SYTMPRLERRGIDPFSAPGVVPGMIGAILLCLALILFVRSIRRGGYRLFSSGKSVDVQTPNTGAVSRVSLTLLISVLYAIGFLGRVNYSVATAIYIFGFICLFEYRPGVSMTDQKKMFIHAIVQAIIGAVSITLVFQKLFLVDLP